MLVMSVVSYLYTICFVDANIFVICYLQSIRKDKVQDYFV